MTQDKELLLKDLCARLPYGVKISIPELWTSEKKIEVLNEIFKGDDGEFRCNDSGMLIKHVKPYLFPLSRLNSLTDEQKKTLKVLCDWNDEEADAQSILVLYQKHFVMKSDVIDWLHKNHFDYRGLIEKELAIDATGLNIY